jgi:threonyl-tRNA synthetase
MENGEIAVRTRGGEDLGKMSVDAFIEMLSEEVNSRS